MSDRTNQAVTVAVGPRRLTRDFAALLIDCDGVLVDTANLTAEAMSLWAKSLDLDIATVSMVATGRRMADIMHELVGSDAAEAQIDNFQNLELQLVGETKACPGARELLEVLNGRGKWAVVTSASRHLAERRLAAAKLPYPAVLVSAEDVLRGKPFPDCYTLAAARLRVATADCLAIDDLPIGTTAARKAGAFALLLAGRGQSHEPHSIRSLHSLSATIVDGRVRVHANLNPTN